MCFLHPEDKQGFAKKERRPSLCCEVGHFWVGGCMAKVLLLASAQTCKYHMSHLSEANSILGALLAFSAEDSEK